MAEVVAIMAEAVEAIKETAAAAAVMAVAVVVVEAEADHSGAAAEAVEVAAMRTPAAVPTVTATAQAAEPMHMPRHRRMPTEVAGSVLASRTIATKCRDEYILFSFHSFA